MIDFSPAQLTWIVIGACSLGGTGYMTIDSRMQDMTTKVEVTNVKVVEMSDRVAELKAQLTRIEDKLDKKK
jgi:polyhydroxyalkanoate synthesis regulator phasin